MSNFLKNFLQQAEEHSAMRPASLGKMLKVRVDAGWRLWVDGDVQFFVGNGEKESEMALVEAKDYLAEHGDIKDAWRAIVAGFRVTQYADTSVIDEGDYPLQEDKVFYVTAARRKDAFRNNEYHPNWEWENFLEQTIQSDESGFDVESMCGRDVWAQIKSVPHPKYDATDPETHNATTGYYFNERDADGFETGEEKWTVKWNRYLARVFNTEEELREYAASLGAYGESESSSSGNDYGLTIPQKWYDTNLTDADWEESLQNIAATIVSPVRDEYEDAKTPVKKKAVLRPVLDRVMTDYEDTGLDEMAEEVVQAILEQDPPF